MIDHQIGLRVKIKTSDERRTLDPFYGKTGTIISELVSIPGEDVVCMVELDAPDPKVWVALNSLDLE